MASGISVTTARDVEWSTTALALVMLTVRLTFQRYQPRPYDLSSFFVIASIIVVVARTGVTYFMLRYGTANDALLTPDQNFDEVDLEKIRIGSILSLAARILITTFYWLQSIILLLFYIRFVSHIPSILAIIRICWVTIVASYVAVILSTFLECRPFHLYWQVKPNPGHCVRAYVQISFQSISNVIIDLELLAISSPLLRMQGRDWRRHVKIGCLFVLGIFCTIFTCVRAVKIYTQKSSESTRSVWASVQLLVSTFVANAPTIYGSWQLRSRKRASNAGIPLGRNRSVNEEILVQEGTPTKAGGSLRRAELEDIMSDGLTRVKSTDNKLQWQHIELSEPLNKNECDLRSSDSRGNHRA